MAAFRRNNIDLPRDDPRVMHAKDPIAYQHPHPSPFSPHTHPPPHACLTTYTATATVPSTAPTKLIHPSRTITAPTSSHASKQDDEDELEVIGSGISGPYRRDKHAIPPALPNLKYDHPETTVQNYSPGTSLVFNAYKGHAALLAQPYHASEDDDSSYRDYRVIQNPSERDLHPSSDYAYARRPDFYPDYHDEIERRGRYNPSPGRMDREARDPKGPDNRAPPPEYYQHPRSPQSHPQSNSQSHSHPRPPPPMPYHERDHPTEGTQHNYNSSLYNSRSDPYYPHHEGPWTSEHRPYSAAIDIPQPNRLLPPNYNRSTSGTQANYRDIDRNSQQSGRHPYQPYDRSSHPMPPGSRVPTGPRYALSQVNYRMIYEYAREVQDCLIKGKVGSTDRLLYNAEILSKVFMGCRVDQDPAEIAEEETAVNPHQPRCASCNIVKTPEWRKGPLGPRTLCNACGLIWGKMSRSKAALAKAAKQVEESKDEAPPEMSEASGSQSSSVLDDTNMLDISPTHLNTDKDPMEVSRKRPRDPTPVEPEIDELEDDSSMDGDINIKEDVAIPVEGLHISSNIQSTSGSFPSSSAADASVSPKTPSHATTSTSMHQRQHQHMLPHEVPSDAMVLGELGKAPVTGKKLALSYLLD